MHNENIEGSWAYLWAGKEWELWGRSIHSVLRSDRVYKQSIHCQETWLLGACSRSLFWLAVSGHEHKSALLSSPRCFCVAVVPRRHLSKIKYGIIVEMVL